MKRRISCVRRPLVIGGMLVILLAAATNIFAQPPVPHAVMIGDDCLGCHQAGVAGAPRVAWDHLGRSNDDCARCHEVVGVPAGEIPHPIVGRDDCLSCHLEGVGSTPRLSGSHLDYTNDDCITCHPLSASGQEATPVPTPAPSPADEHGDVSASSCVSCHQLIFVDEEHALFTGQPLGDAEIGAELYGQVCAGCHGENGNTPVGEEGKVINTEEYWGAHDDAAIMQDIGTGSHGEMTAFAEDYGGPLTWEQILDLGAFLRTWGPIAVQSAAAGPPTYITSIGPLLTERCGACHGGSAGLTVTDYQALMTGASSGPVVVPGDPDGSRIIQIQRDGHFGQLAETELEVLVSWIDAGAPEQ